MFLVLGQVDLTIWHDLPGGQMLHAILAPKLIAACQWVGLDSGLSHIANFLGGEEQIFKNLATDHVIDSSGKAAMALELT